MNKEPTVSINGPATVIISGQDLITYMRLRQEGYTTQWVGEGKIALRAPEVKR